MRLSRTGLALAQASVVLTWLVATGADAEPTPPSFTVSPDHGPAGTVVQLKGKDCISRGNPTHYANASLYRNDDPGDVPGSRADKTYPVLPDGSWGGDLQIPAGSPPGGYHFAVDCYWFMSDAVLSAGQQPFTVDGPSPTTTPSPTTIPSPSGSPVISPTPNSTPTVRVTPKPTTGGSVRVAAPRDTTRPVVPTLTRPASTAPGTPPRTSSPNPVRSTAAPVPDVQVLRQAGNGGLAGDMAAVTLAIVLFGLTSGLLVYTRRS